jgi:hypothetical protein
MQMNTRFLLAAVFAATATASDHSMGTLVECTNGCRWATGDGRLVTGSEMRELMVKQHVPGATDSREATTARRNLQRHMDYLEGSNALVRNCKSG